MKHYVAAQLRSGLTAFAKAVRRIRKSPGDAEELHDVRVASRRFQQALRLFEDFLDRKHTKQMQKRIRRLMKRCGAVRNCDVTLELLSELEIQHPDHRAKLDAARAELQGELEGELKHWHGDDSPARWRVWVRPRSPRGTTWDAHQTAAVNATRVLPSMSEDFFGQGALAVEKQADADLHEFRLLCKRFRYSLELFEDVYGTGCAVRLQSLRKLQSLLGEINDCAVALEQTVVHADVTSALRLQLEARRSRFFAFWKQFSRQRKDWKRWLEGAGEHENLRFAPRRGRAAQAGSR